MKKYFFIVLLIVSSVYAHCQSYAQTADSLKIDSLKKLLPSLMGTSHVDCMQLIALHFGYMGPWGGFKFKKESIKYYYSLAYQEAKKSDYKQGIALSLLGLLPDSAKEKTIWEAIQIGEKIKSDKILGWAYYTLADNPDHPLDFHKHAEFYKKAVSHFLKAGDTLTAGEVSIWLSMEYSVHAEYENAFEYAKSSIELLKRENPDFASWQKELIIMASGCMADLYATAGDYEAALNQLRIASYGPHEAAGIFLEMGQYDSALVYWNKWRNQPNLFINTNSLHRVSQYPIMARIYLYNKEYDKAIELLSNCIDTLRQYMKPPRNFKPGGQQWLYMAEAYTGKKNFTIALSYANEALHLAQNINSRSDIMKCCQLLSFIYHQQGKNDKAYKYLLKYTITKDSIQSKQLILRLYNYKKAAEDAKKESRIGFLNRDNQIKQQQLKQEATFRNFIIAAFVALLFAGLYVFRNITLKRKNERLKQEQKEQEWKLKELESENKHVELQKQSADLEMQALRAQMNPHFIFNSLSSINHFILKNESKTASNYLTRFSRLIRMVLINSQKSLITLDDELQMLELYLEMERLRFKNSFDYSITFLNTIDSDNIFIPPLLLQPFCENAIWHGLMHKEGQGTLAIELSMENKSLNCTITDNGIGRLKAEEMKSKTAEKEKSLGLKITADRLHLLNLEKNIQTFYTIEDLKDSDSKAIGTRVNLKISYSETTESINS